MGTVEGLPTGERPPDASPADLYAWARACGADDTAAQDLLRMLGDVQAAVLDEGPVVHGWDDARWTLARVAELIERRFEVTYTLRGVSYLLHRMGYSLQVPGRRAVERDERAITTWHRRRWPAVKRLAAARDA